MRYRTTTEDVDAWQWRQGRQDELIGDGVPVVGTAGRSLIISYNGAHRHVDEGDWIVRRSFGWEINADEEFRAFYAEILDEPRNAALGAEAIHLERVGYRRWDPETTAWTWRHGGLSLAEAEAGGWTPLYELVAT